MNQLAIAIQRLTAGNKDMDGLHLTPSEQLALKSIDCLNELTPADVKLYIQESGDPTEWLSPIKLATS